MDAPAHSDSDPFIDAAIVGIGRLALWVGLAYTFAAAVALPPFVSFIRTSGARVSWQWDLYALVYAIRAAGGIVMFLGGIAARRRTRGQLGAMGLGAVLVLVSSALEVTGYGILVLQRRAPGQTNLIGASLIQAAALSVPAIAVLLLAWASPVRGVFLRTSRYGRRDACNP